MRGVTTEENSRVGEAPVQNCISTGQKKSQAYTETGKITAERVAWK